MERKKSVRTWLVLAGVPLLGCMSLTHYERTEILRGAEPRQTVAFESPQTAERFARAVHRRWREAEASPLKTESAGVLFLCCYSKTTSLGENAFYNDQVRACDLNGDGLITEGEVSFYEQHGDGLSHVHRKHFGPVKVEVSEAPLLPAPDPLPSQGPPAPDR
jgi:hypothetical protein